MIIIINVLRNVKFQNVVMVGIMMTRKNYILPSLVCPILLNIYFILVNGDYEIATILGGFGFYSFFTFSLVNLLGWPSHFFMVVIKQDNYIISGMLGGIIGTLIFFLLAPEHAYFSIDVLYFMLPGIMTGILFRFLLYYRIRKN